MPKSDTWPRGVSVESVSGMDSAGSCDSVLSINSGFSDDSLEHLSAEERACLMFLEETIESLEAEEDSGLSNDEADRPSNGPKAKTAQQPSIHQNRSEGLSTHEDPNKVIGRDRKPSQKYLVPTPLLLASGNPRIVSKPMETSPGNAKIVIKPMETSPGNVKIVIKPLETSPKETPVAFIDAPDGFRSSPDLQQPIKTIPEEATSKVATSKPSAGKSLDVVDLPPSFIPKPPVKTSLLSDSKAKDGASKSLDGKSQKVSSEVPLEFIPPPSDFMDEPAEKISLAYSPPAPVYEEPPEWIPELPKVEPGVSIKPTEMTKSEPESQNVIKNLHKKASLKESPHLTPLIVAQHSAPDKSMTLSLSSDHSPAAAKEYGDPKSPPIVAPKPKKLPSNIILKSHKDPGTTNSLLPQTERAQMDPQKVRMEALKKLGLLKNEEAETGHGVSPSQSPTFKAKTRPQSLCNPTEPVQELSRLSETPIPDDVQLVADTLKHQDEKRREDSVKKQPAKSFNIKTASLERTGSRTPADATPQTANPERTQVELSPGQLRKSRARPPSAGSAKDFGIGPQVEDSIKMLQAAAVQPGNDGQKLPRSGISVMISPHGTNGENRREALKKLGLLRD
ncbi:specifically androgen-regulated gene protein [Puntigrus tetrazona]|uniref:specifically androgen-regulated gene protein n=1 Tax=Puntigrus tetrazona TaxID=1606681 RepID=UPI001C8A9FE6|nr:specifically androgen-regulated gene protein [Puntigrus tetrazona]XP_043086149.1 specifically androgen-regulated gene protein [Puntigrus tetrazona]XP_043086150.1 specifically androgen-regulated gene protein [Puntigrus tetrazona]XP_043086152.1 specifically androgen-regulated gene protein [Puntigrus tetrazona]